MNPPVRCATLSGARDIGRELNTNRDGTGGLFAHCASKLHHLIGGNKMPEKGIEGIVALYPLARTVLAVARTRIAGGGVFSWAAYVDSVPGQSHPLEAAEVLKTGTKLEERIARQLFTHPPYSDLEYAP